MNASCSAKTGQVYQGYCYAYPHKTAYRPLLEPRRLGEVWKEESKDNLFLYVHVPFCSSRCAYCNLFSSVAADTEVQAAYVDTLGRQAATIGSELGTFKISQAAMGGGTPSLLHPVFLERLFNMMADFCGRPLAETGLSFEVSPVAIDAPRLALMKAAGVTRVSVGIQTFDAGEARSLGRRQSDRQVRETLDGIRSTGFPVLNIDLIYGIEGQDRSSWLRTLARALEYCPEEVYLYPLYIRPLTLLGAGKKGWDDRRLELYTTGRQYLLAAGYVQQSMRMFHLPRPQKKADRDYCCQEDGMVGLGCGARSYTSNLHWATRYSVSSTVSRMIINTYIRTTDFSLADHGIWLDTDEQRRRYILKTVLRYPGLELSTYLRNFGTDPLTDYPILAELITSDLARTETGHYALTETGLRLSDMIGPALYSDRVRGLMEGYEWHQA